MEENEARRQLCKMQGEVADRLGIRANCICGGSEGDCVCDVPDEIINEMWELIADGYLFRYVREIFRVERPKGRRLNLEELKLDEVERLKNRVKELEKELDERYSLAGRIG